jgi:hypothetical protein
VKADFQVGVTPSSVAIGDLNGDGKPDLAVANSGSASVSVLLGNGDGSFGLKTDFVAGTGARSVAIGDLNGDGKPDLAVANYGIALTNAYSNTVSVLLGNGDGSFGVKTDFGVGTGAYSVGIGDLNGDARLDLAVANFHSNTVSVLLGNGDGNFVLKTDFGTGSGPISVAIGDLNGDANPDLVVANSGSNSVSVLLNTEGGGSTATLLAMFDAIARNDGIELRWSFGDASRVTTVAVERALHIVGPWLSIAPELRDESGVTVALDRTAGDSGEHFYRLVVQLTDGSRAVFGPVSASYGEAPSQSDRMLLSSNPTSGGTRVQYGVARAGRVRLELLDVSGRVEDTLADRVQPPGRYVVSWDGVGPRGRASPGLYFVRLVTPDQVTTRKLAIIR